MKARSALLILSVCCSLSMSCKRDAEPSRSVPWRAPALTPVVLISIDTLRSDRLPAYGYDRVATPAIDALRRDAILFERAYTHIGLTLPSHASILSGRTPLELELRDNIGYRFPESAPSLSAVLQDAGYRTGGFVSSYVLRSDTGIGRGFEVYDDEIEYETGKQIGGLQRPGLETFERARAWLEEAHRSPLLLFFHIYEPHAPYAPSEPYASLYDSAYDGEVAAADAVVGDLIAELERLDVYDRALVILLSDHGEGLMDHGEMDHLVFIYREVLQVPLLVKLPGNHRGGSSVGAPAQLTDVAPTIYAVLGLDPGAPLAGRSLLELGDDPTPPRTVFSESVYPRIHFGWSDLASMIEGDYHYIAAPRPELFDLRKDPGERSNLVAEHPQVVRRLHRQLRELDRSLSPPGQDDAEALARLAALGYLSGGAGAAEGPLPDPKDRVEVIGQLGRAATFGQEGKWREAADTYRDIVEREPRMALVWQQLGGALGRLDQRREAIEAYEKALELSRGAPHLATTLAELHFEAGDLDRARRHAELAADREPMAHDVLAKVALSEGDLEAAERHLARAIAGRGRRIAPLITQAAVLNRQGRYDQALAVSAVAEAAFGAREDEAVLMNLFFHRGTTLGHLGRFDEAKIAYRRAIELGPDHLQAYSALAFLLALEGDGPEAGKVLQRMVTENITPGAYAEAVRTLRAMNDEASAAAVLAQARKRWPGSEVLGSL